MVQVTMRVRLLQLVGACLLLTCSFVQTSAQTDYALSKVVSETDVQKKLAVTGSYVRPMSPAKVMAFIQADQQMWKPILERIAANP